MKKVITGENGPKSSLPFSSALQVGEWVFVNEIYKEFFHAPYPARTTFMNCLGSLLKFEVEVIAMKPS